MMDFSGGKELGNSRGCAYILCRSGEAETLYLVCGGNAFGQDIQKPMPLFGKSLSYILAFPLAIPQYIVYDKANVSVPAPDIWGERDKKTTKEDAP